MYTYIAFEIKARLLKHIKLRMNKKYQELYLKTIAHILFLINYCSFHFRHYP